MKYIYIYLQLIRIEKPIGFLLLLIPCITSILLASSEFTNFPVAEILIFSLGSILMRGAGCIINDICDKNIDSLVSRTKNRPIASGSVSITHALILLSVILFISFLLLLNLNLLTIGIGIFSLIPVSLYPLMKRITWWPQLFLGITFNLGALMGWTSITGEINFIAILLYIAFIFWTLAYDTIYGLQDKTDDILIGVKSTSIKFYNYSKIFIVFCYLVMISILAFIGSLLKHNVFYNISLLVILLFVMLQLSKLDIDNPKSCKSTFEASFFVGFFLVLGILLDKFI